MALALAVSPQYTNVTDTSQLDRHCMTAQVALMHSIAWQQKQCECLSDERHCTQAPGNTSLYQR